MIPVSMRTATPVSNMTSREYQSSIRSLQALMDRIDSVRMTLNDQDPVRRTLERVMRELLQVQSQIVQQYDNLKKVDV